MQSRKRIQRMEEKEGRKGNVVACTMAKKVYVDTKPVGATIAGKWTWLEAGGSRYAGEDLQGIADEINQ